jgi:hypothetical protein
VRCGGDANEKRRARSERGGGGGAQMKKEMSEYKKLSGEMTARISNLDRLREQEKLAAEAALAEVRQEVELVRPFRPFSCPFGALLAALSLPL